jgi:hypothetical protein
MNVVLVQLPRQLCVLTAAHLLLLKHGSCRTTGLRGAELPSQYLAVLCQEGVVSCLLEACGNLEMALRQPVMSLINTLLYTGQQAFAGQFVQVWMGVLAYLLIGGPSLTHQCIVLYGVPADQLKSSDMLFAYAAFGQRQAGYTGHHTRDAWVLSAFVI